MYSKLSAVGNFDSWKQYLLGWAMRGPLHNVGAVMMTGQTFSCSMGGRMLLLLFDNHMALSREG